MEQITGNEPIKGWASTLDSEGLSYGNGNDGITIRQYFAAKAMQGVLANSNFLQNHQDIDIHILAVKNADYLIAELNKNPEK